MKDLVISSNKLKKEILFFAVCFVAAFIINIIAVIIYKTPWYEMFTQIGYVLVITLVIYFMVILFRVIILLIKKLFVRKS